MEDQFKAITDRLDSLEQSHAEKDQQISGLTESVTNLEKSHAEKDMQIDGLTESVEELQKAHAEKDKTIEGLSKSIATLKKENVALKESVIPAAAAKPPEPPKIPTETFKTDKGEFAFQIPVFFYKGQKVTAEDALLDDEILNHLVESKSGAIKQVH